MITPDMFFDTAHIVAMAEKSLLTAPMHITDRVAPHSEGNIHEYYSNGPYWWPDPSTPDGLPFIRRDGETNPESFYFHRNCLGLMKCAVANLAAGYMVSGREEFAEHAVRILREFFLDPDTYMAPHLEYAQAIPGVCSGRGIGVIDTLCLAEVPFAIEALSASAAMTPEILSGLRRWFSDYLTWMDTHPYGVAERDYHNNHAISWHVQALSFARFVGNSRIIKECVTRYREVLLPCQMRQDGAFKDELTRTKPYSYSIFVLELLVSMAHIASLAGEDIWSFELPDGRSVRRGIDFLIPYMEDKSTWFLPADVEHFDTMPHKTPFIILAALHYSDDRLAQLYFSLPNEPDFDQVRFSSSIVQPILML